MKNYNPDKALDMMEWNNLDESEQITLVERYHERERIKLPNSMLHAMFHVIVENQVALGDEISVSRTLERLIAEGLDRHDAIHAIGAVLAGHMHSLIVGKGSQARPENYESELEGLTAKKWRESGEY